MDLTFNFHEKGMYSNGNKQQLTGNLSESRNIFDVE